jgi:hypothetical protein
LEGITPYNEWSIDKLFMDYTEIPVTAQDKGRTYTWYLPPHSHGNSHNVYRTEDYFDPPRTALLDPTLAKTGVSRAMRLVLTGSCGGQTVKFTIYTGNGEYTPGYNTGQTRLTYGVGTGYAYNYHVEIVGVDAGDGRVEIVGAQDEPAEPDDDYMRTWTCVVDQKTEKFTVGSETLIYEATNNEGVVLQSFTIENLKWTPITDRGRAPTEEFFYGYRLTGTLIHNEEEYPTQQIAIRHGYWDYAKSGDEGSVTLYVSADNSNWMARGHTGWPQSPFTEAQFYENPPITEP